MSHRSAFLGIFTNGGWQGVPLNLPSLEAWVFFFFYYFHCIPSPPYLLQLLNLHPRLGIVKERGVRRSDAMNSPIWIPNRPPLTSNSFAFTSGISLRNKNWQTVGTNSPLFWWNEAVTWRYTFWRHEIVKDCI